MISTRIAQRQVLLLLALITQGNCSGRIIHGKFFGTLNQNRLIDKLTVNNVSESWITQPLDHFTPKDTRTWSQRYVKSDEYYTEGGPICIWVSGESEMSQAWILRGLMVEQCSKLGAALYGLEHRFFGKSQPLSDASVESLRYLSIQQALADLAAFIPFIKTKDELGQNTKIILYGGSYAGTLVAYFKHKYPKLATVCLASSGPIGWKYNFLEYNELTGKVIQLQSSTCHSTISSGIKELRAKLNAADCSSSTCPVDLFPLKLCSELNVRNKQDILTLYSVISDTFAYFVQYNGMVKFGITDACKYMDELPANKTSFEKLAETLNHLNFQLENSCLSVSYKDLCEYLSSESWDSDAVSSGGRTWYWMVCNEVASFQTTLIHTTYPYEMNVFPGFYASQCQCAFGKKYTESFIQFALHKTLNHYTGVRFARNRVVYTNGEFDPWGTIGIPNSPVLSNSKDLPLILKISGGSHCNDLYRTRESDSTSVLETRERIFEYIKESLIQT